MRRTRLSSYYCHVLILAVKASPFLALENLFQARKVGSSYDLAIELCRLIFYESVLLIVLSVAQDSIHKSDELLFLTENN